MKRILTVISAVALLAVSAMAADKPFNPKQVKNATAEQVTRVEPLSWWTGMKMPLQLLVQGKNISAADVRIEGGNGVALWSNPAVIIAIAVMLGTFILNFV